MLTWQQVLPFVEQDLCRDFFEQLEGNFCVGYDLGGGTGLASESWCYVESGCDEASARLVPGTRVAWKLCSSVGEDVSLKDLPSAALEDLAASSDGLDGDLLWEAAGRS